MSFLKPTCTSVNCTGYGYEGNTLHDLLKQPIKKNSLRQKSACDGSFPNKIKRNCEWREKLKF